MKSPYVSGLKDAYSHSSLVSEIKVELHAEYSPYLKQRVTNVFYCPKLTSKKEGDED